MQTKTTQLRVISEGQRVATVARDGARQARNYPIWVGAIYEAKARKSDGLMTWRRVGSFGPTRSGHKPSNKFVQILKEEAPYLWLDNVRHGNYVLPIEE